MKKLLLSLLALFAVLSASAITKSYTLEFNCGTYDNSAVAKTYPERFVVSGLEYIKCVDDASNCYYIKNDGVRIGTSGKNGTLVFVLNTPIKITAVEISANIWSKDVASLSVYLDEITAPQKVEGLKSNEYSSIEMDNLNPDGSLVSKITLMSIKRIRVNAIKITYEEDDLEEPDPSVAPETPVVTVNGAVYEDNAEIAVEKGDKITVESQNASEMLVNGEAQPIDNGVYEFLAETSDIYTFQGKNGDKTSEEVTVILDVDDLSWQVVVGEMQTNVFDMTDPAGLTPGFAVPATGNGTNVGATVVTGNNVAISFTDGSTPTRFWNTSGKVDLRVYASGGTVTVSGEGITKIVFTVDASNYGFSVSDGAMTFDSSAKTYTWNAPEGQAFDNVVFTATKQNRIQAIEVVSGGSETMVKAPEFYVGDVKLDASGDYAHGIKVEAGAVIKIMSHERTHLHYYVDGEEEAAANVKALMTVNEEEIPWIANESAQKHVYEYTVPAQQTKDITIHAKGVKEGYKSVAARMVLSADRIATGIDGIEAEGAEGVAEYFNLQGQRVMNPANGLFIKKTGEKVTKVIL